MKYEIGDKIILLHSKEEGTVVDIVNQEMVMVEVGKVTFPVYLDQIDFPYFYRFTEKKPASAPPRKIPGDELPIEKRNTKPSGWIRAYSCLCCLFTSLMG